MIREEIKKILNIPDVQIERPENEKFGDYSTNAALKLAKNERKNPMEIVEEIKKSLEFRIKNQDFFEKIEIVKPGFLNFFLAKEFLQKEIGQILEDGSDYGKSDIGQNKKVQVEFISANPTGPLTLGNGRGGFFGDTLARILQKSGFNVQRAYYINDAGYQVEVLGHSVLGDEEAQYKGEYIEKLHKQDFVSMPGISVKVIGATSTISIMSEIIKPTIEKRMKINFDEWISEQGIRESGLLEKILGILKEKNLTYEEGGAVWFKSTEFGDDKDRVLITSLKTGGSKKRLIYCQTQRVITKNLFWINLIKLLMFGARTIMVMWRVYRRLAKH